MTGGGFASQWNPGREHLVVQLARPFGVQRIVEQRLEFVCFGVELFHQVLHAIAIALLRSKRINAGSFAINSCRKTR